MLIQCLLFFRLFSLPYLWYLDVAYNDISVIPSEIKNLRYINSMNWNQTYTLQYCEADHDLCYIIVNMV